MNSFLASPFLCLAVALHGVYLATGTADGIVRSFIYFDSTVYVKHSIIILVTEVPSTGMCCCVSVYIFRSEFMTYLSIKDSRSYTNLMLQMS